MAKRFNHSDKRDKLPYAEDDPAIEAFIEDLIALCKRHDLWLSHEDGHGSFIVSKVQDTEDWLREAGVEIDPDEDPHG